MPASGGKAPWKTGKKALKAKGAGIDFKVRNVAPLFQSSSELLEFFSSLIAGLDFIFRWLFLGFACTESSWMSEFFWAN